MRTTAACRVFPPIATLIAVIAIATTTHAAPSPDAYELRNLGLAQLENERPADAEATWRKLVVAAPREPLAHADLAIALLRQQKFDDALAAIDAALKLAPGRPDLVAIRGEVLLWKNDRDAALVELDRAAKAAPNDLEILYRLYRHASSMRGPAAESATQFAVERLAELRPENLFVMLRVGQAAIARGDRARATGAYLRIRELLWQAQPIAQTALEGVLDALEKNDFEGARVPSLRLENVLKVTPMFRGGLAELSSGIQGVPVTRFADEPPPTTFGKAVPIELRARKIEGAAKGGAALVAADLDGDDQIDLARLIAAPSPALEIRLGRGGLAKATTLPAPASLTSLLALDLDNDGALDLLGAGGRLVLWRGDGKGGFRDDTAAFGLTKRRDSLAVAFDYDQEGDLDLATAGEGGRLDLLRNALSGPLEAVGDRAFAGTAKAAATGGAAPGKAPAGAPPTSPGAPRALRASDLDRDGDPDLVVLGDRGLGVLDNLRQGRFVDRTAERGLAKTPGASAMAIADLDDDGWPDLVLAGPGLTLLHNRRGVFEKWSVTGDLPDSAAAFTAILAIDADNDGRLDLALGGPSGLALLTQPSPGVFLRATTIPVSSAAKTSRTGPVAALAAADLDRDGDLDLVLSGPDGLARVDNAGGNANAWLDVRLRGLTQGNDKNNRFGVGATVEVKAGKAYQFREADGGVVHFGLGAIQSPDLLRVVWTNGVPQNRIAPKRDQSLVEEQVLKGSCPFLYTETGHGIEFVTDLLWGAPLGMPVAEGVWAGWNLSELVRVDGAAPIGGRYDLRITEELWEAAFFDVAKLWVVDHPANVEVASNLRILPGAPSDDRVLAAADVHPVVAAWDGRGRDVTSRIAARDEVYADGYERGAAQGVAARPWTFMFDLGAAPAAAVRLLLEGWIFPADASLNLAVAQRTEPLAATRLEMETADGWRPLLAPMGDPPGKTKLMMIDTPPLPAGVHRLRIVTSKWLHWDRIAWTTAARDDQPRVMAKLAPATAVLHRRGFSRVERRAPNAPHWFDYATVSLESPWLAFPGRYTRYGDVRELLLDPDDRQVILAAGDEIALTFDAASLPPPPPGWRRTVFLESHGWDKDADRNTWEATQMEPLPFRAMKSYPYAEGERYPETPELRRYREEWLTREVPASSDSPTLQRIVQ